MSVITRLIGVQLHNVKNVEYGTIEFTKEKDLLKCLNNHPVSINGIYGPNGSGKTALVESLLLFRLLVTNKYIVLDDFINGLITIDADQSSIVYKLLITDKKIFYIASYEVAFQRVTDEKEKKRIILNKESLSVKQIFSSTNTGRLSQKSLVKDFSINYDKIDSVYNQEYFEKHSKKCNQVELNKMLEYKTRCKTERDSFLFSSFNQNILTECAQQNGDAHLILKVLNAIHGYASANLSVFTNDESSLAYLNSIFIHIRQNNSTFSEIDELFIDLEKDNEVKKSKYEKHYKNVFREINEVMPSFIDGFSIEPKVIGTKLNDKNEEMVVFTVLSTTNGKTIPLAYESSGIKKILAIISFLIGVYNDESVTLVVDEFDSGVFEFLLGQLLKVFDRFAKGQLIFTAHNSRGLEMLDANQVVFTTTNKDNRYIRVKNLKRSNNFRDFYYRAIVLGGQDEKLYYESTETKIALAFSVREDDANGQT